MPESRSTITRILNLILRRRCSRAALAKALHLSRPGISNPVERLIARKLVIEDGCGKSSGGKPPILLRINPKAFSTIGIDLGNSLKIRGILCSGDGEAVAQETASQSHNFDTIFASCIEMVEKLKQQSPCPVGMIGIAVPGPVDRQNNEIIHCTYFPLENRDLAKRLSAECGIPVVLENRAKAAAMWEYYFGTGAGCGNFVFISAGHGIGSAVYCEGKLFVGSSGQAGELSSLMLPAFEPEKMLPVEQAMSEQYLLNLAQASTPDEMLEKARRNDAKAEVAIHYMAENTARLIYLLSDLFDPEMVILGGRFRDFDEKFLQKLGRCRVPTLLAIGGRNGSALGAALLVLERMITKTGADF